MTTSHAFISGVFFNTFSTVVLVQRVGRVVARFFDVILLFVLFGHDSPP